METLIVGGIILVAVSFIARRAWRTVQAARHPKSGCSDCGCSTATPRD